jgi:predicted Rossmann fold flavoprotein
LFLFFKKESAVLFAKKKRTTPINWLLRRMTNFDVMVVGAGAAGLMCALTAGRRGRRVLLLDHNPEAGAKILISGGGRCNFTNTGTVPERFISDNPHFCRSALGRYTPRDFVALVDRHRIAYHEKTLGQLFCDGPARAIVRMLLDECAAAGVKLRLGCRVAAVRSGFEVDTDQGAVSAESLVVASGGLSIPKMGATGFAYEIARQFGLRLTDIRPALVPLCFDGALLDRMRPLAGVAFEAFGKRVCSPIAACPAPPCCKYPPTGGRARSP